VGIDLSVYSRERPSNELLAEAFRAFGYASEDERPSLAEWTKLERGPICVEVLPIEEHTGSEPWPADTRWETWLSLSSIPHKNTLTDAYRVSLHVARALNGTAYDPQSDEVLPYDLEVVDFRDGLAGLWDVLREYHNARRECRRQAQSF
jgi:hypothetical protein